MSYCSLGSPSDVESSESLVGAVAFAALGAFMIPALLYRCLIENERAQDAPQKRPVPYRRSTSLILQCSHFAASLFDGLSFTRPEAVEL